MLFNFNNYVVVVLLQHSVALHQLMFLLFFDQKIPLEVDIES